MIKQQNIETDFDIIIYKISLTFTMTSNNYNIEEKFELRSRSNFWHIFFSYKL